MVGRDDGNLAGADLDRFLPDAQRYTTLEHMEGQAPALVVLVKVRTAAECEENESKSSGLEQCLGVPITVEIFDFGTQAGGFLGDIEP